MIKELKRKCKFIEENKICKFHKHLSKFPFLTAGYIAVVMQTTTKKSCRLLLVNYCMIFKALRNKVLKDFPVLYYNLLQ
jgi:hypothetical protein